MATVFMKWLEREPESYDRGIRLLTLGRIDRIRNNLVMKYVRQGMKVLEIGCGTGEFACQMAKAGAEVTSIDIAPDMLAIAEERVQRENLADRVELVRLDATAIGESFSSRNFDLVVASLILSELSINEQKLVIGEAGKLLESDGRMILVDEVNPQGIITRLVYHLFRLPVLLVTFLLTRTTARAIRDVESLLNQQGFHLREKVDYLGGSLCAFVAEPSLIIDRVETEISLPHIRRRSSLRNLLVDIWTLFFRIVPPYPKISPGLYKIGNPESNSPLLTTGNFDLTIRKILQALDGKFEAWLLVVDSAGINVWCAAGGGFFTAEKIISALKANRVETYVNHKTMILPQLCANGVSGWVIREETEWEVVWGPIAAKDIPEFVEAGYKKTDQMRMIRFPIKDRLEMVSGTFGLYSLMLLLPIAIFWRHLFWPTLFTLAGLSYFYALALPWLPGRDGLWKSIPLTLISLSGLILFTFIFDPVTSQSFYNRAFGVAALSIFVSGEFQGMSPLMRGEQANWIPEAIIGGFLALVYWLTPFALGWR